VPPLGSLGVAVTLSALVYWFIGFCSCHAILLGMTFGLKLSPMRMIRNMRAVKNQEMWNVYSHGIGVLLGIVALFFMIDLARAHPHPLAIIACAIYGATLIVLYLASTAYHAAREPHVKKLLKVLDHSSIYLLIAGTYTPFTLITLHGPWGWTLFGIIWGMAALGVAFKLFYTGQYEFISVVVYLVMGWLVVIAMEPLMHHLAFGGFMWLLAGGLCYTFGVIFYVWDDRLFLAHFIWHLCVLAGSICQFIAVVRYVIL
jgi:hemolysin III